MKERTDKQQITARKKTQTWRQRLTKTNDDLLRQVIRQRDGDTCQWCSKHITGSNSQPSHVIPKSRSLLLRWNLLNVKLLCTSCHRKWHLNPVAGVEWFRTRFPARYEYLRLRQHQLTLWHKSDYQKICDLLKEKLVELEEPL